MKIIFDQNTKAISEEKAERFERLKLQDKIAVCLAKIAFARHFEMISFESVVFSRFK